MQPRAEVLAGPLSSLLARKVGSAVAVAAVEDNFVEGTRMVVLAVGTDRAVLVVASLFVFSFSVVAALVACVVVARATVEDNRPAVVVLADIGVDSF